MSPPRRPSSYDVARRAGVSQSAVSRAFDPGAPASPAMRAKVHRAATELGYRPNLMARAVTTRSSCAVGLVMPQETALNLPQVVVALTRALAANGLAAMLHTPADADEARVAVERILAYRNDGVVAAGPMPGDALDLLAAAGVPVVIYNRPPGPRGLPSVSCDHGGSARIVAEQLLAHGHRRVGIIAGPPASIVAAERLDVLVATIEGTGANAVIEAGDYSYASGAAAMRRLAASGVTAVAAISDMMAVGAIDAATTELGLRVPDDLSIVGFDGLPAAQWARYRLSTVAQPLELLAEAAAQLMAACLTDRSLPPERRVIAGRWVEGATLAAPPP